ncbi:MAG TPA: hypothetical protein VNO86_08100 [Candidatus Binatia bacterium]|nr:hypothetical protein [Candidatus Binatia bacterium]
MTRNVRRVVVVGVVAVVIVAALVVVMVSGLGLSLIHLPPPS